MSWRGLDFLIWIHFLNDGYCGEGSPSPRMNGSGAALESAVYPRTSILGLLAPGIGQD